MVDVMVRYGCRYNPHCARRAIGHSGILLRTAELAARAPRMTGCRRAVQVLARIHQPQVCP
jgi:hypothetical protein